MPIYFHGNRVAPVKLVYSGGYDTYSGSYTINPAITATILSTSNKLLTQNITITAMPSLTLPQITANSATSGYTFITTIDPSTSDRYINIGTGYNNNASYYKISKMPSGTAGTPAATKGSVSNNTISITPTVTNTTGYITGSIITGNPVSVSASELVSDTLSITSNGIKDVTNYASVNVNISASSVVNNQNKTITPTESQQIISADNGYTGLGNVTIQPISSTYIGSEIDLRDSTDLSVSGSTITVPSGYYSVSASKSVSSGTAGTPTALKGAVTNHSISITPSVTNITGYITGSTKTGTAVSVTASELVSGTLSITSNGTKDVTNYKNVNVQIGSDINNQDKTISPTTSEQIITADSGYSGLGTVTINAMPSGAVTAPASISGSSATVSNGTNTITLTKTISVTPNVTTAGYVSSGTAGNASVSLTANVTTKGATSYTPTTTSQTIVSGTYLTGTQTILGDSNLVAGNIKKNISIFGVTGTYEPPAGDTINNQDKTVIPTESEQSISADSGYTGLGVVTVEGISSTYIGSDITQRSSSDLTVSGATVTAPAGYYTSDASASVKSMTPVLSNESAGSLWNTVNATTTMQYVNLPVGYNSTARYVRIWASGGTAGTPTASKGTVSNHSINITPSVTNTTGYITGGTKNGTAVTVSASELVSGNKSITSNGTNIDVTNYATVSVAVPTGSTINNQDKTVTPTESEQIINADEDYTGLGEVTITAISSTYVGSGITQRDSSDLTASSNVITAPAGYYSAVATYTMARRDLLAPTVTIDTTQGIVTGTSTIAANKAGWYAGAQTASKTLQLTTQEGATIAPTESEQTAVAANVYTLGAIKIGAVSSSYVGSAITRRSSSDLTASGATVTIPAGYYASQATKSVTTMTLPTSAASSATSGYTSKATISRSTSDQYINIPTGYNSAGAYYKVNAVENMTLPTSASSSATSGYTSKATVGRSTSNQYINIPPGYNSAGGYYTISATPNGSVTAPSTISGTTASVSTGTNTLTLTKTISVTPNVTTAGYISAGTAGNSSVSLTATVATQGARIISPSTTDEIITSGTYLTGNMTVKAVQISGLTAANIKSGVTVKVGDELDDDCVATITGTFTSDATATTHSIVSGDTAYVDGRLITGDLVINNYYTGSSAPSSSLGSNGDIYIQQ